MIDGISSLSNNNVSSPQESSASQSKANPEDQGKFEQAINPNNTEKTKKELEEESFAALIRGSYQQMFQSNDRIQQEIQQQYEEAHKEDQ